MQRLTEPQQLPSTDALLASLPSSLTAGTSGPVLPTPSDATNLGRTALSQPAPFLNCTHTTGHILTTFAMSDGSSGSTAMTQPEIVATRSTTAKLRAARHANNLGNTSMSQSAAAAVATSEPASSTAIQPPGANSSASTVKPATHADAAASGSAFPVKAAEGAPCFPSCAPAVPTSSTTASPEGGSSEQTDSTAPPGNKCNTLSPESSCSTIGADRKLASAARPRNELISVGIQLPPGTLTPKLPLYDLLATIVSTARLSPKDSEEVTLQAKPAQSLVFLKTHSPLTANLLLSLTHLQLQGKQVTVKTYAPNPPISCLGVIHNVGGHFTSSQLLNDLESFTTDILGARMMGTTESVLITFSGTVIPRFVHFKRVSFRCRPHKPKPPTCTHCLALGHRAHQCPQYSTAAKCRRCAVPLTTAPTSHVCAQLWCIHCQVNTHSSLDPTCPFLLAKQRECAKAAFLRRTAMRRATQPPPSSSSPVRESASTSAPSPPGSYAAVVKAPSALSHSSSSNTPPLPLTNENRSFELRLAMLERNQREQQSVSHGLQQQIHSLTQTLQATTSCLTSQLTELNKQLSVFTTPPSTAQIAPLTNLIEDTTTAHHTRLVQLETSIVQILSTLQTQSKQLESLASTLQSLKGPLPPAKKKERVPATRIPVH